MNGEAVTAIGALETATRPARIGFLGTGWIGRLRMDALAKARCAELLAVCDADPRLAAEAAASVPGVHAAARFEDLLVDPRLDGVVIATPSALHAEQCRRALRAGKAVFCQKPLATNLAQTRAVVATARAHDRLLGVDFSYRHLARMDELRRMLHDGELGEVFAAELVFHNAYGPDKPWFYDLAQSGGGCVMDLGVHLIDLITWLLPGREVGSVDAHLCRRGRALSRPCSEVEDFARVHFSLGETDVQLCCSWNLNAGRDAIIEASLYGTRGGASVHNVNGSFFDFELHSLRGTSRTRLGGYPDDWGGRALIEWARALGRSRHFNPEILQVVRVAEVLDKVYDR